MPESHSCHSPGRAPEALEDAQRRLRAGVPVEIDAAASDRLRSLTDSQLATFASNHGVPTSNDDGPFSREQIIQAALVKGAGSPADFAGIV